MKHDICQHSFSLSCQIATQFLAKSLSACSRHSLSHRQMAQIAIDVASGLEYLHACGFLHLDITPSNVMLALELAEGDMDAPRAVLIDFGLAVKMDAGRDFTVIRGGR